ncbi:uncharacterized protein G2W53_014599 [Senna tora]|uniref:Uncharacterized protein n=1 Tax=Senna tora TaxID=362788 RepID=A0A834WTR6_9FABA|nr:uncharacterized protein G2W53_014599 [Senna tora]
MKIMLREDYKTESKSAAEIRAEIVVAYLQEDHED